MLPDLADRNIRQRDIVPPEKLEKVAVLIVGVGAVGRQLALQLATMGVSRLTIVDPQDVDVENLGAQGFREKDLGQKKVDAVASAVQELNSNLVMMAHADFFRPHHVPKATAGQQCAVFVCVDTMGARADIWKHAKLSHFYVDSRMGAEVARVITVTDPKSEGYYPKTLFSDAEMYEAACTAKTTIYCANIQAGLLALQFTKWLRGFQLNMDMMLNLIAEELDHDLVQDPEAAAV